MKDADYPILVVWAEQDQAYLARVIDLPGCIADGATPEEALANARVVIKEWIETAQELGRQVPQPADDATLRKRIASAAEEERREFEEAVETTAHQLVDQLLPQVVAKVSIESESTRHSIFGFSGYGSSRKLSLAAS